MISEENLKVESCRKRKVSYIWDNEYHKCIDENGKIRGRASLVHSLICSYGLLRQMQVVSSRIASTAELETFHSADYVECVRSTSEDGVEVDDDVLEEYGLGYDCPVNHGTYKYAAFCAGASIAAADCLLSGAADVAINWGGGWHHAKKDESAGFCYFNDIVLAILRLRTKFQRIIYIDIDIHHGDGVEQAFWFSDHVLTLSLHQFSPGFYPGTGSNGDKGQGRGRNYCVNVPLGEGCRDEEYCRVFSEIANEAFRCFSPHCVVMQCGADSLVGDPLGGFNLTLNAPTHCVRTVFGWGLPTLLLGGGGYDSANTARLWTALTAEAVGQALNDDIPDTCSTFTRFGPDYRLELDPRTGPSRNREEKLQEVIHTARCTLKKLADA